MGVLRPPGWAYLDTTTGPRAVLGSQRVRPRSRRGISSSVRPRWLLLRAEDGSRSVPFGRSITTRRFAGDAAFALQKALINAGGIETPSRSQQGDSGKIGRHCVPFAEGGVLIGNA